MMLCFVSRMLAAALMIVSMPGPMFAATARCREGGVASAPVITAADLRAIDRAVVTLPAVRLRQVQMSIGAIQPLGVETKAVPDAVRKVLPQFAGYQAFRTGHHLVIIKPGSRRLAYILPLQRTRGALPPACL